MKRLTAIAVLGVLLTGCGTSRVEPATQVISASSDSKVLELEVDFCSSDLTTEVQETPDKVVVTVTGQNDTNSDCAQRVQVNLVDPLGYRRVVDGVSGATVGESAPTP